MSYTALSLSSSSLRPLSSASRPKTTNPRKPSHKIPKPNPNPNSNPNPNLKFRIGGQATTYTRLPPKDDPSLGSEIKLIESISPKFEITPKPPFPEKNSVDSSFYEEIIIQEDEESDFDDEMIEVPELGFDIDVDGDDEDEEFKEKGVPAVMRCFDRAKIYVKAGDGGNGVVAFRREKFVPFGGPSGGDGGKGGNVYVEVDGSMNSLLPFRKNVHFRAERGSHGQGRKQVGARGEDVVVKVAPGTVVREAKKGEVEGEVLLELVRPGQRALILPGGRGGRGNASFKSGTNKVPKIAENGEEGAEL